MNRTIGVLISGRGSNLKAIIDAIKDRRLDASIAVVISNRADAQGLDHAIAAGVETMVLSHKSFATREDYDRALVAELKTRGVALVCLAGFMRLLTPWFVEQWQGRISRKPVAEALNLANLDEPASLPAASSSGLFTI